jgi:alpha-tubulin suppressor-like RCC1 family protein
MPFGAGNATCAISHADGTVQCWGWYEPSGNNRSVVPPVGFSSGELGVVSDIPIQVVFADTSQCDIVASGGTIECWGSNGDGELGDGSMSSGDEGATTVGGFASVGAIAGGFRHFCVIEGPSAPEGGSGVVCWGTSAAGESGAAGADVTTPAHILDSSGITLGKCTAVTAGADFSCAACNGRVLCWGAGRFGIAGSNAPKINELANPVAIPFDSALDVVAGGGGSQTGADHVCALHSTTSNLGCWGIGARGELGIGVRGSPRPSFVPVP